MSSRGGEVARQWFIQGDGIDRHVISHDIQRYLGNDATVRPGVGTGENQGVPGYWIKAYRNLTSAMIADLRTDTIRWRQEQRQTGSGDTYADSRTFQQSNAANAARINRPRDNNSPSVEDYSMPPRQGDGRQGRQPVDPMQIDSAPGRGPQGQYIQQNFFPPDPRSGQYPPDPSRGGFPPQGRGGQGYPDQSTVDMYGQPDAYGRFPINQYPPERPGRNNNYGQQQPPMGPPSGYTQQGEYYVPMTTGYPPSNMMATAGADPAYYGGGGPGRQPPPPQQQRGGEQPPQTGGRSQRGESNYSQEFNPYPSPAQTVLDPNPRGAPPSSGYGSQNSYDQFGRPVSNPQYGQYAPEPVYPPPGRDVNPRQAGPSGRDSDRRHRRNG